MTETAASHLSRRVDNYIKYRPHYPSAIVDLLEAECGFVPAHSLADIGTGTGILAELFLQNGNPVYGVEPDPDMRAGAEYYLQTYPQFTPVAGTAESTTLPGHSVDYVTVGQAFHWFNIERARKEFIRILVPRGWVVLVWNVQRPSGTPFLVALQEFWENDQFWNYASRRAASQMARVQSYRLDRDLFRREMLEPLFMRGSFKEAAFENPMICDFERLRGRILSNGNALGPGDPNYALMLESLKRLFETHQENGTVTIEHDTRVVYGKLLEIE